MAARRLEPLFVPANSRRVILFAAAATMTTMTRMLAEFVLPDAANGKMTADARVREEPDEDDDDDDDEEKDDQDDEQDDGNSDGYSE
jgi:hypothetical protein